MSSNENNLSFKEYKLSTESSRLKIPGLGLLKLKLGVASSFHCLNISEPIGTKLINIKLVVINIILDIEW